MRATRVSWGGQGAEGGRRFCFSSVWNAAGDRLLFLSLSLGSRRLTASTILFWAFDDVYETGVVVVVVVFVVAATLSASSRFGNAGAASPNTLATVAFF